MKQKQIKLFLAVCLLLALGILIYFTLPIALVVYDAVQAWNERAARNLDFEHNTIPLSGDVIQDLCVKFELDASDQRCQPNAVVYAPMFFDDIKRYFKTLPYSEATYQMVDNKLGPYLVMCERPGPEGDYLCRYDITGDGIYPIAIYFNKDGFYFRIMASFGDT